MNPNPASLRVDFDGVRLLGNLNKSLAGINSCLLQLTYIDYRLC